MVHRVAAIEESLWDLGPEPIHGQVGRFVEFTRSVSAEEESKDHVHGSPLLAQVGGAGSAL
jgi:hypothetical protein